MHIRSLLVMWKETQYIGSVLKKYSDVLVPGKYYIYNSFRAMCLDSEQTRVAADPLFYMKKPYRAREKTAQILNKAKWFHNRNKMSSGEYDALYIANNEDSEREIKLFSFQRKQVLSICKNEETMQKQLQEYAQLSHAYPMPRVVKSQHYPTGLDVDMVCCKPIPGENAALSAIARATATYNPEPDRLSYEPTEELIAFSYGDGQMNELLGQLSERIAPELLSCPFPLCLQHGDLSRVNMLYGICGEREDFWFIDWEHKKERVFFYDYFFYVLCSALYGDMEPLSCYISGQNDGALGMLFEHFRLRFDPDKRWDYLLVGAVCFLKERVCDLGNLTTLKTYCNAIIGFCQISGGEEKL